MKLKIYLVLICSIFIYGMTKVKALDELVLYDVDAHFQSRVENHPEFTRDLRILYLKDKHAFSLNVEQSLKQVVAEEDNLYYKGLSSSQIEFLRKVYINGYDKNNKKIYMAAQEIIWEYLSDYKVYWTDNNGNEINLEQEKNIILNSIESTSSKLNINQNIDGNYFEEIILEDEQLDGCKIINESSNVIKLEKEKLKIKIKETGNFTILKKTTSTMPEIYHPLNSPYLLLFTDEQSENVFNITLKSKKTAYIEIKFTYNNQPIDGIVKLEIDDKKYETNDMGYFLSQDTYELGEKNIKIISLPNKYQLKENKISIELKDENINNSQTIKIKQELEPKKGKIKIKRFGITNNVKKELNNVEYSLYAKEDILLDGKTIYKSGQKIRDILTDDKGEIIIDDVFLGKYILIEKNIYDYLKFNNTEIVLDEENNIYDNEIATYHKPLNINIYNYFQNNYYLYNGDKLVSKLNENNNLYIDYGEYDLIVKDKNRIVKNIDILFDKNSATYNFHFNEKDLPLVFEMPKTGMFFKYTKFFSLTKSKYEF